MAKLILSHGANVLGEYELNKETITIGRRPSNDIQVENLAVSGEHAKVITILNDSFLEDLNSTNGTYVNGSLIKKHALQDGDIISVGKHQLKYVNENASNGDDFEKTMIIRPDEAGISKSAKPASQESMGQINAGIKKAAQGVDTSGKIAQKARLKLLSGGNAGKELEIKKALITLGKPGVQVAAITRRPKGYFIIHIDGGNGTGHPTLNGKEISSTATPLNDNDIIEVAGVKMEFMLD